MSTTQVSQAAVSLKAYVLEGAEVTRRSAHECAEDAARAADTIASAFRSGGKLLICGNGGSAADSQHIATEFTSTLTRDFEREPLPAIALTADTSFLTAFSNDFGYDGVFERLVHGLGHRGDALLGLTTSGNSRNVVRAIAAANSQGMATISFTGQDGGEAAHLAAIAVRVPSRVTGHIQEAHIALAHGLCAAVEDILFPGRRAAKAASR